jgi:hypothetical protein
VDQRADRRAARERYWNPDTSTQQYQELSIEYAFGPSDKPGTGVWEQKPKTLPKDREETGLFNKYREELKMGSFKAIPHKLRKSIDDLKRQWPGQKYDPLTRNCNHFSDTVCKQFVGCEIPKWVNKLAGVGNKVMQSLAQGLAQASVPSVQVNVDTHSGIGRVNVYTPNTQI